MAEINIQTEVARHRVPTSNFGALLGRQFCKPESVACIKDFDKIIADNANHGNLNLLPNRTPRRFRIKTFDVLSAAAKYVRGTGGVILNEGMEGGGEVFLPYDSENKQFGKMTPDAVEKALKKEDPNIVFSDIKATADEMNEYNRDEIRRIDTLISSLNEAKQKINSAIAENDRKASEYLRELADSKVDPVDFTKPSGSTTTIVVHNDED